MEEKNGDNGKRRESERLTTQQNKIYTRRPLSNRTSDNYQVSRTIHVYCFIISLNMFFCLNLNKDQS